MKIPIGNKDEKDKKVILLSRAYDVGTEVSVEPKDFNTMLETNRHPTSISRYSFEVKMFGIIENILDEYIGYLTNPEFLWTVKFTSEQANAIKYNTNAVSHLLYGDINMAWTIPFLNDLVKHASDLTYELLTRNGVVAFNANGITALKTLLSIKRTNQENAGTTVDREPIFNLDSF